MPRTPDEATKRARTLVYRPIVETLAARGISQTWLAQQLGLTRHRLWNYLNGFDRVPPDFIERACQAAGIPPSFITVPEPRALYIQQPRTKHATPQQSSHKSTQSTTATTTTRQPASPSAGRTKGRRHDDTSRTDTHGNGNGNGGHGSATQRPDQPRRLRRAGRPQAPDFPTEYPASF